MRPEYGRLARDFERLVSGYGRKLPQAAHEDVGVLAASIECIDRVLDALAERGDRDRLAQAVLHALTDGEMPRDWGDEIRVRTGDLRAVVVRRDVVGAFARVARDAMRNAERLRTCTSVDAYVARVAREGRLTARLALLVAGDACTGAFTRFFVALGEPANLVDKLRDARGDAARGEIVVRPGLRLHARLFVEILRRVPVLLRLYPRRAWLLAWGAGYLFSPT